MIINLSHQAKNFILLHNVLFTDPSNRQPRSWYVLRYSNFAHDQLNQALESVAAAERSLGEQEWQGALKDHKGMAMLIADSRLAKDKVEASIR